MVKSEAFHKGYEYQGPKHHNPYWTDYAPHNAIKGHEQDADDWTHGWLTRFYGETI